MRSRRSRNISALAAFFTAAALGTPALAHASTPAADSPSTASPAVPTVTPAGSGAAAVVLPTGDRLVVHSGAQPGVTIAKDAGSSDAFATFDVAGDHYVVPAEAAPYLGHGLDLSLFDVTKLAAAPSTEGHIPVVLRFAAGVTPTAPAGVTFTSVTGQTATGYLTAGSGRAFAQALRDAVKADLAAGRHAGSGTLFGGLTSMAALGATPPVQPHYPLHILQVNALDDTGAPADTQIILVNTDKARSFSAPVYSYQGVARVAVPAGNYAAVSLNFGFGADGHITKLELVTADGITVPDTGTVPAATVDARTATSPVTFTTQKPATQMALETDVTRVSADGGSFTLGLVSGGGAPVFVTPTPKPAIGSLSFVVDWLGQSPASSATPYRYNLGEVSDHIAADQNHAPSDSSLATVQHTLNLDPHYGSSQALFGSGLVTATGYSLVGMTAPASTFAEYVTAGQKWVSEMTLPFVFDPGNPVFAPAFLDSDPRAYRAGQFAARTWGQAPVVANFGQHPAGAMNMYGCQACSSGGAIDALLGMLGDSNRDTTGLDFGASGTSQLYWNGQLLSSDTNHYGYVLKDVSGAGKLRMVIDYDRTAGGTTQAAKTHTDVTIPYSGHDDPSMKLPAGTYCGAADVSGDATAPCSVLPALSLNYQLNGLTNRNTTHSPMQNLVLHVGHISYGDVGSQAGITSAQVSVSFDDGATWKDVPTHGAFGTYAAHWANPAPGGHVSLRVTATDCLGGSITQTVTDPYTVG
ncbi:MAG: hypothetical protein HOV83_34810 [Catenulispora sp.]|nr:hypothetical protein [Catenulispora sp.]